MKQKNSKNYSFLLTLCLFALEPLALAQTPTPTFTPAPTINDVVSLGTTSSNTVWIQMPNNGGITPVPLPSYIEGVLWAELRDGGDSSRQNAYTALAIAASSKWAATYNQELAAITATPGVTCPRCLHHLLSHTIERVS
jgi:hypothetical protein